jgi:hypothetical protein
MPDSPPTSTSTGASLGLELKEAWCQRMLKGEKTVELRRYSINPAFLGA